MTPRECDALLRQLARGIEMRERAATLRAGLITAAIYNVNRKPGTRALQATDFVQEPTRIVSAEEMRQHLAAWVRTQKRKPAR